MRTHTLFLTLLFLPLFAFAQDDRTVWRNLADVSYVEKNVDGQKMEHPVFGREAKKIDGVEVTVRGYILPYEISGTNKFIFSAYPNSSCYFCGGAGPETVIEVASIKKIFYSAKPVLIKGRIKLNADNLDHMMYMMESAERVDE